MAVMFSRPQYGRGRQDAAPAGSAPRRVSLLALSPSSQQLLRSLLHLHQVLHVLAKLPPDHGSSVEAVLHLTCPDQLPVNHGTYREAETDGEVRPTATAPSGRSEEKKSDEEAPLSLVSQTPKPMSTEASLTRISTSSPVECRTPPNDQEDNTSRCESSVHHMSPPNLSPSKEHCVQGPPPSLQSISGSRVVKTRAGNTELLGSDLVHISAICDGEDVSIGTRPTAYSKKDIINHRDEIDKNSSGSLDEALVDDCEAQQIRSCESAASVCPQDMVLPGEDQGDGLTCSSRWSTSFSNLPDLVMGLEHLPDLLAEV